MAKKHNVKLTKGTFKLVGKVKGTASKRFFENKTYDSGAEKNKLNFAISTSPTNESYVQLEGFVQKVAKFNKFDGKTKTNSTKETSWNTRFDVADEPEFDGYSPMFGTKLSFTGDVKDAISLFQYDACQELKDSLEDGMSFYVEGNLSFSSQKKDGEVRRYRNLDVTKAYKQEKDVDFEDAKFAEMNKFKQEIIFMGIEQEKNPETDKATGRFLLSAKIVTSDGVEDTEFVVTDKELASKFKARVKPYNAITVEGRLITRAEEEAVEATKDSEVWGEPEEFDSSPHVTRFRELVITTVLATTLDTETYSEKVLASITQAEDDFGAIASSEESEDDVWN